MTALDFTNCNAFKSGRAERRMYLFILVNSSTGSRCPCTFLARYSRLMKLRALVSYPSPHRRALFNFFCHQYLVYLCIHMRNIIKGFSGTVFLIRANIIRVENLCLVIDIPLRFINRHKDMPGVTSIN